MSHYLSALVVSSMLITSLSVEAAPRRQRSCSKSLVSSSKKAKIPDALKNQAHQFMLDNNMGIDMESNFPRFKLKTVWELDQIVKFDKHNDLLIMHLISYRDGKRNEVSKEFEVIVRVRQPDGSFMLTRFEEAFAHQIPKSAVFQIGYPQHEDKRNLGHYYYAELEGEGLIDALKSIYSHIPYHGFLGIVLGDKKADFDPTPNRRWRVVDARFSLLRGMTHETGDIQSYHWDEDFDGYFSGSLKAQTKDGKTGAEINPWGQSAVIRIISQKN